MYLANHNNINLRSCDFWFGDESDFASEQILGLIPFRFHAIRNAHAPSTIAVHSSNSLQPDLLGLFASLRERIWCGQQIRPSYPFEDRRCKLGMKFAIRDVISVMARYQLLSLADALLQRRFRYVRPAESINSPEGVCCGHSSSPWIYID